MLQFIVIMWHLRLRIHVCGNGVSCQAPITDDIQNPFISNDFDMISMSVVAGGKVKSFLKRLFSVERGCGGCGRCGISSAGLKEVDVGGSIIMVKGLDDLFQRFYERGWRPDDLNGDELLGELGPVNYLAEDKRNAYKEALLRKYRTYYEGKKE